MKTKILFLIFICFFIFAYCNSPADPEIKKALNPGNPGYVEPIETIEQEDESLTAIEIIGEPEVFYTCADIDPEGYVREKLEFRLRIKNISYKTITACSLIVVGYPKNPEGSWDYLLWYRFMASQSFMPQNILHGEERIISTVDIYPLYLGTQDETRCVILRDEGKTEFRFEAYF